MIVFNKTNYNKFKNFYIMTLLFIKVIYKKKYKKGLNKTNNKKYQFFITYENYIIFILNLIEKKLYLTNKVF